MPSILSKARGTMTNVMNRFRLLKNSLGSRPQRPRPVLSTIGLPVPADFASVSYESVNRRLSAKNDSHPDPWAHYAGAWNAVAYRFISCTQHDELFTRSVERHGCSPQSPERFIQEKELFGFFVTGLSSLESFCYAAYAIAAMVDALNFPLSRPRDIIPEKTSATFSNTFPAEPLTVALNKLVNDHSFSDWKDVRNILAHRTAPARKFHRGGPEDGLAQWLNDIPIDTATTASRRTWLAGTMRGLLDAAAVFAASHL